MLDQFAEQILEKFPNLPNTRTLLAVSGGMDSVFMVHLFARADWPFGIAHCNFQLRGMDSVGDQEFVRALADRFQVPFYTIDFATEKEAAKRSVSIQMIARTLRYDWLVQIRQDHQYDQLATAHHLNDSIETSLINQSRGTGIRGLLGVPAQQGAIIRPLSMLTREAIATWTEKENMVFREDSSNLKDTYSRNRIRHHVIPVLKSINPALEASFQKNMAIWSESAYLMDWACKELSKYYLSGNEDQRRIDYGFMDQHAPAALSLMYEWLKEYGFHIDQLSQAINNKSSPGKVWYSSSHRLLTDRNAFLVEPLKKESAEPAVVLLQHPGETIILKNGMLRSQIELKSEPVSFTKSVWEAQLDAEKIRFPLKLRHWQEGDTFCPLGMAGQHKKIQDFFTDSKISRFDKEKIWLVLSANDDIIWIMGHRIDERFKLDQSTARVLKLQFKPKTEV